MPVADVFVQMAHSAFVELALFAAVGFVIGGIDELLIDVIWLFRSGWRKLTVYRRHARTFAVDLPDPPAAFRLAVFIPTWQEANVVASMLRGALQAYRGAEVTIFVACYPNDAETITAARSVRSDRIRVIVGKADGPSTKADNLNLLWRALAEAGETYDAVCLHDAEDVISPFEANVVAHLLPRFGLLQFPVVPLSKGTSRWIGGHYCDEFAESHGKTLVVREALGAALPLAGVGCIIRMDALRRLAAASAGAPFDAGSLTEDYETGLKLGATGCASAFVRMLDRPGGELVATRAHFPETFEAAIRQKARWVIGIGISGWDRLGWGRGLVENWMRLRDRLSLLSALVLCAGYLAFALGALLLVVQFLGGPPLDVPQVLGKLMAATLGLMIWRVLVRAFFVGRIYGASEGLIAIPRTVFGNAIAIVAAGRAIGRYLTMLRRGAIEWDKTTHRYPDQIA